MTYCSVSATFQVNLSVTIRLSSAQYFTVGKWPPSALGGSIVCQQ